MASLCIGCEDNYMSAFARFYDKDDVALHFLREHGVLPFTVKCPKCNKDCSFREDKQLWRCLKTYITPKGKKEKV